MSSEGYHEPIDLITEETKDLHRGIVSLIEELEAIDWYQQRADACSDGELRLILLHHRDEEIEHAMMNLEWLRRKSPAFDRKARTYLFSEGSITEVEAREEAESGGQKSGSSGGSEPGSMGGSTKGSLGVGSLRRR